MDVYAVGLYVAAEAWRAEREAGRAALDAEGSKVRTDKGGRQLRVTTITPRMNASGKAELCVCSWR